jgi:glucoamylase
VADGASLASGFVPIKNRPPGESAEPAAAIVSPDALALVRFGLRAPDDPRIVNTVQVIDAILKVDLPFGPGWHRYDDDGYGEHEDGSPFDGTGVGRVWPLLAGERAHYELAAGRRDVAERLLHTLEASANEGGMIPEQTWDSPDIPDRELFFGRPSGSAMPLVWAHAEYVKLRRSLHEGRVFDMPPQTVQRYVLGKAGCPPVIWCVHQKCRSMPAGRTLRVMSRVRAVVHWSVDGWHTWQDTELGDSGLDLFLADLPTAHLAPGAAVVFTFYWPEAARWENADFEVSVE